MFSNIKKETVLGVLLLAAFLLLSTKGIRQTAAQQEKEQNAAPVVVIDPGHGGDDSGKVGINGALEKDVNLAIAGKLENCLQKAGVSVVMTRREDRALCTEQDSCKKQEDMRNRCARIDQADPVFTVSIHQNSYTQESIRGPQVFYYTQSKEGEAAAACIQEALNTGLAVERPRTQKGNATYYLLKKTKSPAIIVECGFLSNYEEAEKLVTEDYQQQVAEAVGAGVLEYLQIVSEKECPSIQKTVVR